MSMALYRRYRPQKFQDLIGQEQVTKPLMAALRGDKTVHAYLFSGPRGCGKTTSARILARCLNCAQGPTDTPCGECASCKELSPMGSGSLDVVEMDAASHGSVDDARELLERASFAPARDRYKIFIVDEAHMVSKAGFNALLKMVEEPPEYIKFIFATTEPDKVITTIRSRTHHYPFRLVAPDVLENYIAELCKEENIDVDDGVLPIVVRSGGGSVRDTLSVLDQLIGGSESSHLAYGDAVRLLGLTDSALIDTFMGSYVGSDPKAMFAVVKNVAGSGLDPRRFVEDILQRFRDMLILAFTGDAGIDIIGHVPGDQLALMKMHAHALGTDRLTMCADIANDTLNSMVGATSPLLFLELLCARLLMGNSASVPAVSESVVSPQDSQKVQIFQSDQEVLRKQPNSGSQTPNEPQPERREGDFPAPKGGAPGFSVSSQQADSVSQVQLSQQIPSAVQNQRLQQQGNSAPNAQSQSMPAVQTSQVPARNDNNSSLHSYREIKWFDKFPSDVQAIIKNADARFKENGKNLIFYFSSSDDVHAFNALEFIREKSPLFSAELLPGSIENSQGDQLPKDEAAYEAADHKEEVDVVVSSVELPESAQLQQKKNEREDEKENYDIDFPSFDTITPPSPVEEAFPQAPSAPPPSALGQENAGRYISSENPFDSDDARDDNDIPIDDTYNPYGYIVMPEEDVPFEEEVMSDDDETIEESHVIGLNVALDVLNGKIVDERPLE
ncbi:MAG: DNA polymerase III subunit gamma/tau [Actinomycetaceae bacterium]|nr:DNA polymerase III subunit gamma/tau [Actinomycetaceae bacterium]